MKIFIPIGSFFPNQTNGPSLSLYWLSKGLVENGMDVSIYTTNDGIIDLKLNELLQLGFGKIKYVKTKFLKLPFELLFHSVVDFYKFDVILITSLFYPVSGILLFYSFLFKKKIIISPRGELYNNALNFGNLFLKKIYISLLRFCLKMKPEYYIFHVTSDEEKDTVLKIFGDKVPTIVIPNYIDLPEMPVKTYSKKYMLFLGRIHPDKSLEKLIDGYSLSNRVKELQIRLVLTGDVNTKYGETIKRRISELNLENNIEFVGFIEGESKVKLISEAYCTLLVSNSENFGNSVLESLCFGTPVITSTGTPWEELAVNNCGYWIENNPSNIAKTIDDILSKNSIQYHSMCENARNLAAFKYSIQKNVDVWIKLFLNL